MSDSKVTVTVDGHRYDVGIKDVSKRELYSTSRTTSRIYMSTKDEFPEHEAATLAAATEAGAKTYDGKETTIYTTRGEHPTVDKAWDRHNRAIVKAYKVAVERVFAALTIKPERYHYSRKAGCGCGCSPGFIVQGHFPTPVDIWITEKEVSE